MTRPSSGSKSTSYTETLVENRIEGQCKEWYFHIMIIMEKGPR